MQPFLNRHVSGFLLIDIASVEAPLALALLHQQTSENAIYRTFLKHFLRQVWQEVDVCLGICKWNNLNLTLESENETLSFDARLCVSNSIVVP